MTYSQDDLEQELLARDLRKQNPQQPWAYTPPAKNEDLSAYGASPGTLGSAARGAAQGAAAGSILPGIGTGIGAIAGGVYGLIAGRRNDTKNAREDFAKQLGLPDTTALWSKFSSELPPDQAQELRDRALNRIGKKDVGANQQWMLDVQAALKDAPRSKAAWDASQIAAPPPTEAPTSQTRDSSQWDTDGYAAPGFVPESYGNVLAGYDAGKWANANHQTPKYAVGRILSQYAPSVENAGKAIAEIQKAYPGATFNGKDKITIPGVGSFDVLTNSGSGQNMGWAWQPLDGISSAPASGPLNSDSGGSSLGRINSLVPTDSDFFNRLQAQLVQILGGPQALDRSALLKLLGNN